MALYGCNTRGRYVITIQCIYILFLVDSANPNSSFYAGQGLKFTTYDGTPIPRTLLICSPMEQIASTLVPHNATVIQQGDLGTLTTSASRAPTGTIRTSPTGPTVPPPVTSGTSRVAPPNHQGTRYSTQNITNWRFQNTPGSVTQRPITLNQVQRPVKIPPIII